LVIYTGLEAHVTEHAEVLLLLLLLLLLPQALQGFGLQPQLEHPVQVGAAANIVRPPSIQQHPASLTTSSSSSSKIACLQDDQGSSIMVDIACLAPERLVRTFQQFGVKPALKSHKFNSSSSSNGAIVSANLSADEADVVLLVVEVDGPSHVAVNCWSHALGSTVSRTWLLQHQGWAVLEVPWWEWEAASLLHD
jgi:hypothetical protein